MKENVLDVLIYLFENDLFEQDEMPLDQEVLAAELGEAGFDQGMIDRAFQWLENLSLHNEEQNADGFGSEPGAIRHYHPVEAERLGVGTQGLLLKLQQCGALTPACREMVINQLMALEAEHIDLEEVKWVILMVLYNNDEGMSEWTENLVLEGFHRCLH